MRRKPRNPKQPILTAQLVFRNCLVGLLLLADAFGLFAWKLSHGESLAAVQTVAVNVFVFGELFFIYLTAAPCIISCFMVGCFQILGWLSA